MSESQQQHIQLPTEVWLRIARISPCLWIQITLTVPAVGRHSLKKHIQDRQKKEFIRRETCRRTDIPAHIWHTFEGPVFAVSTKLPNGAYHAIDGTPSYYTTDEVGHAAGVEQWHVDGMLHRGNDHPADIVYGVNNVQMTRIWYKDGVKHREGDNPAIILMHWGGRFIREQCWWFKGKVYRTEHKPQRVAYNNAGVVIREMWILDNGKLHREDDHPADIVYSDNGKLIKEEWWVNGRKHRDGDNPASIIYFEDGSCKEKKWHIRHDCHREGNLPAHIRYYKSGELKDVLYYVNGEFHRDDGGPAIIYGRTNSALGDILPSTEAWYTHGKYHSYGDKPALITRYYFPGKLKTTETWYRDGKIHRSNDLPAIISYDDDYGGIRSEEWRENGKRHRDTQNDKPAVIYYYKHGYKIPSKEMWYCYNKMHRGGSNPASITYYCKNHALKEEKWYHDGKRVREDRKFTRVRLYYYYDKSPVLKKRKIN